VHSVARAFSPCLLRGNRTRPRYTKGVNVNVNVNTTDARCTALLLPAQDIHILLDPIQDTEECCLNKQRTGGSRLFFLQYLVHVVESKSSLSRWVLAAACSESSVLHAGLGVEEWPGARAPLSHVTTLYDTCFGLRVRLASHWEIGSVR
jgi:hypothetical protein